MSVFERDERPERVGLRPSLTGHQQTFVTLALAKPGADREDMSPSLTDGR